jgi:hypothetical protein
MTRAFRTEYMMKVGTGLRHLESEVRSSANSVNDLPSWNLSYYYFVIMCRNISFG